MSTSWRRFAFFAEQPLGTLEYSTVCCGLNDGGLARGDAQGVCHVLDAALRERCAFAAHDRGVTHLLQPRGSDLLFSLGLEAEGAAERTVLRVWRPEAAAADGTAPCLRSVKLLGGALPEPAVTCWCVADDLSQIVCGMGDGTVLLLRTTDLLKERFLRFKPLPSFATPAGAPVTAVHLSHVQSGGAPAELFVLTADAVFSVSGAGLRHEAKKTLTEAGGAAPGCSCTSDEEQLVLGTQQALYFYSADERGPCFAFDGPKQLLCWHRSFLLVASAQPATGGSTAAAAAAAAAASAAAADDDEGVAAAPTGGGGWLLQVYDLKNKLIAHSVAVGSAPRFLFSGPARALLVLADGACVGLEEKDVATKLESLFRKGLYSTALSLATKQGFDPAVMGEIHRQYADHLYARGEYDGAADQYVQTIGHVAPSVVLRKFLDAQRIEQLARYLQALHDHDHDDGRMDGRMGGRMRLACAEHTTLLLSCYTKQRDEARLDTLVGQLVAMAPIGGNGGGDGNGDGNGDGDGALPLDGGAEDGAVQDDAARVDADSAVRVCREAGYAAQALRLARAHGMHGLAAAAMLDDLGDADGAVQLIASLPPPAAWRLVLGWGRTLLQRRPAQTSALVVHLCLARRSLAPLVPPAVSAAAAVPLPTAHDAASGGGGGGGVADALHLFAGQPRWLCHVLEELTAQPPQPPAVWQALLELYLSDTIDKAAAATDEAAAPAADAPPTATSAAAAAAAAEPQPPLLPPAARRRKALELLSSGRGALDEAQALLLCAQHSFEEGALLLLEQKAAEQPLALLRHLVSKGRRRLPPVLRACRRFGDAQPQMWLQCLSFLASMGADEVAACADGGGSGSGGGGGSRGGGGGGSSSDGGGGGGGGGDGEGGEGAGAAAFHAAVAETVEAVEREGLLQPPLLLQLLAQSPMVRVEHVRGYLARQLERDATLASESGAEAARFEEETGRMREEIAELASQPKVFQLSKCSACGTPLQLPSVHFLCMHSFHQACLADNEHECIVCAPQRRRMQQHMQQQQQRANAHDEFFKQLEQADDGFSKISEYFGAGMFGAAPAR